MQPQAPRKSILLSTVGLSVLSIAIAASGLLPAPAAAAEPTCQRVASLQGNDANAGTPAAPVRTVARLFAVTTPGETACLTAGQTFHEVLNVNPSGTPERPITLRSTAGGRATFTGQMRINGSHLRFTDLRFGGTAAVAAMHPKTYHVGVDGDDVRMSDVEITSAKGICLDLGTIDAYGGTPGARADGFVLERSSVHGCGLGNLAAGELTRSDSGIHGIYIKHTYGTRLSDNRIYDNANRGIQHWPNAIATTIEHNVLDGNGSNLNIGSYAPKGFFSQQTIVRNNLITNSELRSCDGCNVPPGDTAQIVGNFPVGSPDYGNLIEANCVFHADASRNFSGPGFIERNNGLSDPRYVDRAANDFRLQAGSPCAGKGPRDGVVTPEPTPADPPADPQPVEPVEPVEPPTEDPDPVDPIEGGNDGDEGGNDGDEGEDPEDEEVRPSIRIFSARRAGKTLRVRIAVPRGGTLTATAKRGSRVLGHKRLRVRAGTVVVSIRLTGKRRPSRVTVALRTADRERLTATAAL